MSEPRFSAEQRAAIERRTGPLALAANAGSGKTSVLVERFVRAVTEDRLPPHRLLAITFTERAAGELRARVRSRLVAEGEREAAADAASAFVSTFHAFASRILRSHPLLAGVAPDFVVLDDGQSAPLRERAFALALEAWLSRDGTLDLAAAFGVDALATAIIEVYSQSRSRGESAPCLPVAGPQPDLLAASARLADACDAIAAELSSATQTLSVSTSLAHVEHCRALLRLPARPSPSALAAVALVRRGKALQTAAADVYEDSRTAYEQALADGLALEAVPRLDELLGEFGRRYDSLKVGRGAVDFDDLELRALALLRGHDEVASAWRERFDRVMVDELQDTNARQMEILGLLTRENLFTVGDEFQSIYAFRHADVAIFRDRFQLLESERRSLVLAANYRSRSAVLDGVNAVFGPRFGERFVPLYPGRDDAAGGPPVELLLADRSGWEEHEDQLGRELAPAPLWRRAEARLLASRIAELVDAGEARPGEIVVLTRASTAADVYEAAIRDRGITTLTPSGEGFYERPEIADLAAYVQALANPFDDIALYGVLSSPLCGASADDLVTLALAARETGATVWAALDRSDDARLADFAQAFAGARELAPARALGEIVTAAISDHSYDLYLAQLAAPERRIANVRKLVRLARDFEREDGRDLRRFADAFAARRLGGLREAEAPPPVGDAVRLMTIHAAKGLEFPVVCLADLGHQPNTSAPRLLTDGDRIGLRLPSSERTAHETLDYRALLGDLRAAQAAEERRVYYVAMTRARERLILSGVGRFEHWEGSGNSAITWLAPALVPDLAQRLTATAPDAELISGADNVPVRLTLCDPSTAAVQLGAPPVPAAGSIAAPVNQPRDASATPSAGPLGERRHSYTALAQFEQCGYRYYLQRVLALPDIEPPAAHANDGVAAASRGVIVHALLEQVDFAAPDAPAFERIVRLAGAAGLSLSEQDMQEIAALAGALALSPLSRRLARCADVGREEPFAFALDGELVSGVFDVAGREADGTFLIVDYKTDRVEEDEDLESHIDRDYSLQRLVYALAGLRAGAERVEVAHCFLRSPTVSLARRYEVEQRQPLEAELRARLAPLRAGHFEVTTAPGRLRCATCPGRPRLCSYDQAQTLRDSPATPVAEVPGDEQLRLL